MGKARPERQETMEAWLSSGGTLTAKELAEKFHVSENMVRKWKSQDKWALKLKKPRGAPKGNQNAKGHGAPAGNQNGAGSGATGNKNAQTHGAYAEPETEKFSDEEWEEVRLAEMLDPALGELTRRRIDLARKIRELEENPKEKFDTGGVDTVKKNSRAGSVVYWESKFQRLEKLEIQYNRVLKNILKIHEERQKDAREKMRIEIERQRLELSRQKAMGIFPEPEEE